MYRKIVFLDGDLAGEEAYQRVSDLALFDLVGEAFSPAPASMGVVIANVIPEWARDQVPMPGAPSGQSHAMGIAVASKESEAEVKRIVERYPAGVGKLERARVRTKEAPKPRRHK